MTRAERAQATVETALVLPVLGLLIAALVQAGVTVRDELLVVHGAREAARAVALEPSAPVARPAAESAGLDPGRLEVSATAGPRPGTRRVTVTYRAAGPAAGGRTHQRELVVAVEPGAA